MNDQFPPEAEGLGVAPGVNDGSTKLAEDFVPTRCELEVLARYHLWILRDWEYICIAYGAIRNGTMRRAEESLYSIAEILGQDRFDKAVVRVEEKFRKYFDDLKVELAAPVKCEKCGREFYREDLCQGCPDSS